MKISNIFAPYLFACQFNENDEDEYTKAINQWNDVQYLKGFFEENRTYIEDNEYFSVKSIECFVDYIIECINEFDKILSNATKEDNLEEHFEFLSKFNDTFEILPKLKSKHFVLRFYGIRIENIYIITGSAIKLTQKMEDHPTTKKELKKLEDALYLLKDYSILDEDSFYDYMVENDD
ncbi:hypothetical protein [Empedobacter brevis]